jgi:iron complex outermembrane receptor protein
MRKHQSSLHIHKGKNGANPVLTTCLFGIFITTCQVVLAQENANKASSYLYIEEVIVTANKRSESIREIAGSVGAVRGDDLEKQNMKDLEGFLKLIPGVSLNKQDAGSSSPSIRGIASDTRLGIAQAPTGIYIDEVPFTGPYASFHTVDINPFDLQRVEVLKGPQATLYGSNSFAGTIRYILEKPRLGAWEAKISYDRVSISEGADGASTQAALNIPLGEEFALRIAGVTRTTPGYIDDLSVGKGVEDANSGDQQQVRALAQWSPAAVPLQLNIAYIKQDSQQDDAGFADQKERLERRNTPTPNVIVNGFELLNLTGNYDLPWASLSSSSALLKKELTSESDGARALGTADQNTTVTKIPASSAEESFSQEIKLSSLDDNDSAWRWLVGLWFTKYDNDFYLGIHQEATVAGQLITFPDALPIIESSDVYNQYMTSTGDEKAIFGELGVTFWERWTATLGARVYKTVLESESHLNGSLTLVATGQPTNDSLATLAEEGVSPKASLKYEHSESFSVYGLVSRGFRFGGNQFIKPPIIFNSDDSIPESYRSDELWNYEVGVRTQWFDQALTLDATAFYSEWTDVQIQRAAVKGLFNYVDNVGGAESKGLEVAIFLAPFANTFLDGLTLSSTAAYIQAVTTVDFPAGQETVASGARLPGTPEYQIANVLSYTRQIGSARTNISLTHSHVDTSPVNIFNTEQAGGYDLIDLGVQLELPEITGSPTVFVGVKNVFDKYELAGATADPAQSYTDYHFIRPRALEISISAFFE